MDLTRWHKERNKAAVAAVQDSSKRPMLPGEFTEQRLRLKAQSLARQKKGRHPTG